MLLPTIETIRDFLFAPKMISTYVLILSVVVLRVAAGRSIARAKPSNPEDRRRLLVSARNLSVLLLLIGLVLIWASELRTFAVSLVAFIAAIILATKEMIMCLSGSLVRTMANTYQIGDRIEIGTARGEVIDITPFATTLIEVGPGPLNHRRTGRAIVFPNSQLLTSTVVNETRLTPFVVHSLTIPVAADQNWEEHEAMLLDAAREVISEYEEEVRANSSRLASEAALDAPATEPSILIQMDDPGKIKLVLRYPTNARKKGRTQDAIMRGYLKRLRERPVPEKKAPSNV